MKMTILDLENWTEHSACTDNYRKFYNDWYHSALMYLRIKETFSGKKYAIQFAFTVEVCKTIKKILQVGLPGIDFCCWFYFLILKH